jgi:LysR family pca operon transcriptional activator
MVDGRIKLRHLQCFLAVAQQRSIQQAADTLSVTQPAVSKSLRELESILGVRLFERGRRGTVATRDGELFLRHAGAALSALREGVASLGAARGGLPLRLAVGVLPTVAPALLTDALAGWDGGGQPLQVTVTEGSNDLLLGLLRRGEVELVVGRLTDPDRLDGLSFEHLLADPLVLVVRPGHPLLADAALTLARVNGYRMLLPARGTVIRHTADSFATGRGIGPWRDCVETLSVSLGRALARASDAVWFVPRGAVRDDLRDGTLVALPIPTPGTDEPLGLTVRAQAPLSAPAAALVARLRTAAASPRSV